MPPSTSSALRWLRRETLGNLFLIAILFGIVGRWDWWPGWALSAIYILWSVLTAAFILPVHPEMLAERARIHPDQRKWDLTLLWLMGVAMLLEYTLACLDVRLGWTGPLPLGVHLGGLALAFIGYDLLLVWSMVTNAFFVATYRIQSERQHAVVSSGPYHWVRHPGYLGTILMHLGVSFLLGSLWALIPGMLAAAVLVIRTALEDKALHAELPGYSDYAARVRWRLLPGVW